MTETKAMDIAKSIVTDICVKRGQYVGFKQIENEYLEEAIARAIDNAIIAERERIADLLEDEADTTPCLEDAMVTRSNAHLIRADFSYEEAERLAAEEEESD